MNIKSQLPVFNFKKELKMIGSIIGGLASLVGANKASKAQQRGISEASNLASKGAASASNILSQYANKAISGYQPYARAGKNALDQLTGYITGRYNIQQDLVNDPNYQATVNQALNAINNSAAASGALRSGATTQALYNQGQNLANQYYQNKLANLQNLVGYGQNATSGLASLYSNTGSNLANIQSGLYGTLGQNALASASAKADKYSALGGLAGQLGTRYDLSKGLQSLGLDSGLAGLFM